LTYEAFLPYGKVVQAFSAPTVAPRGIAKTTNNQGTAAKYHQMAKVENNYGAQEHRTIVSTMRAEPKIKTGDSWDITVLEKSVG
jgi:allantoicase